MRTRVYTSLPVTIYLTDGRITGIEPDGGWDAPTFEVEDNDGNSEQVPANSPEGQAAVAAMEVSTFVVTTKELQHSTEVPEDNHCEQDGSDTCLVHFGRFGLVGNEYTDVCDLSPDWTDV